MSEDQYPSIPFTPDELGASKETIEVVTDLTPSEVPEQIENLIAQLTPAQQKRIASGEAQFRVLVRGSERPEDNGIYKVSRE